MNIARMELPTILHRNFFPDVLNDMGLLGNGAEIGVQDGYYSEAILQKWKGKCLYSVDPWKEFKAATYLDIANISQKAQDVRYEGAKARLSAFGERSMIVRQTSHEASKQFEKDFFDFVYIDANHHYEAVAADLRLWYPKVKVGGILAGHDYMTDGVYPAGVFGVIRAVDEFAFRRGLRVVVSHDMEQTEPTPLPPSWFLIKK